MSFPPPPKLPDPSRPYYSSPTSSAIFVSWSPVFPLRYRTHPPIVIESTQESLSHNALGLLPFFYTPFPPLPPSDRSLGRFPEFSPFLGAGFFLSVQHSSLKIALALLKIVESPSFPSLSKVECVPVVDFPPPCLRARPLPQTLFSQFKSFLLSYVLLDLFSREFRCHLAPQNILKPSCRCPLSTMLTDSLQGPFPPFRPSLYAILGGLSFSFLFGCFWGHGELVYFFVPFPCFPCGRASTVDIAHFPHDGLPPLECVRVSFFFLSILSPMKP